MEGYQRNSLPRDGPAAAWPPSGCSQLRTVRVLVVVEGTHDIRFLRQLGRVLHQDNQSLPDLAGLEQRGDLIFVPYGGGDPASWTGRLTGLRLPKFHLFDRELPPETEARVKAAGLVNQRNGCQAAVTSKRSVENYLHPAAIRDARRIDLSFGNDDDVAELAARQCYLHRHASVPWRLLPGRAKKRLRDRAKHWLNSYAAARMTAVRLAESDPAGEVRSWLATIGRLAGGSS